MGEPRFRPANICILIVDDNQRHLAALGAVLRAQDYAITTAADGRQALDLLRRAKDSDVHQIPHLLISDIEMPHMNGYQLCAAIKSDSSLAALPVILLTTLSRPENILRALEVRADSFLTKPFDEKYLLSRIRSLLETGANNIVQAESYAMESSQGPHCDEEAIEVFLNGTRHPVSAGRRQMLDMLLCTYEHAVYQNHTLTRVQSDLQRLNEELRSQAQRLEASRLNYRSLLENSDDAIVVVDGVGQVCYVNAAATALFGRSKEAFLSQIFDWPLTKEFTREVEITRPKKGRRASERDATEKVIAELRVGETEWEGAPAFMATLRDITARKQYEGQIEEQQRELREANAALERLATLDSLTGLKNRRALKERLADEMRRASRYQQPLSLVMLDVDRFKQYNDSFGHPAGDVVLQELSRILLECARTSDFAARYGGEEFAILLPNTDGPSAKILAERLRLAIQDAQWPQRALTASLGVATMTPTQVGDEALNTLSEHLIAAADRVLYQSKDKGRNQTTAIELGEC